MKVHIQKIHSKKRLKKLEVFFFNCIQLRNLTILLINECGYQILNRNLLSKALISKRIKEQPDYKELQLINLIQNSKYYSQIRKITNKLQTAVSRNIIFQVIQDFESYFKSVKSYYKNRNKFKSKPKPPRARKINKIINFSVAFTSICFSQKENLLKLAIFVNNKRMKFKIPKNIKCSSLRLCKKFDEYELHCIYKDNEIINNIELNDNYVLSIDIGLNNLATCFSNNPNLNSFIIDGKQIKRLNAWYNKKVAQLKSEQSKYDYKTKEWNEYQKQIRKLGKIRERKLKSWFHLISTRLIEICLKYKISKIIVSKNILKSKNGINIGKRNNQNFVYIPFNKLISNLEYKSEKHGIKLIFINEAYTSKSDCLTNEINEVIKLNNKNKKQFNFKGKRIKRGLFKHYNGLISNADVNGSINIAKLFNPNILNDLNEKLIKIKLTRPKRITIFKLQNLKSLDILESNSPDCPELKVKHNALPHSSITIMYKNDYNFA